MNYEMLDRNKLNELDAYIESFEDKPSHLIMILHRAQGLFGYLPKELQIYVAEKTGVPAAKVYGVVTFYSFFTMKPKGRHTISVCMGTACFVKGGERILDVVKDELGVEVGQMTEDGMFTLEQVHCLGRLLAGASHLHRWQGLRPCHPRQSQRDHPELLH